MKYKGEWFSVCAGGVRNCANWVFLSFIVTFPCSISAQSTPMVFKAAELQRVAVELTGSENGWPVVNKLAQYDPSANTFKLDSKALDLLKLYKEASRKRELTRKKYIEELAVGAKLFAPKQIVVCDSLYDLFLRFTIEGSAKECIDLVPKMQTAVDQMARENKKNRIQQAEARLIEKQGRVDRKKGALGSWQEVPAGELFAEEDGIKTAEASSAKLTFTDGSQVTLESSSTAIVRQSRIDQFSKNTDTEVVLSVGSAVTSTNTEMSRSNEFRLKAGPTTSTVKSGKFWTETDGGDQVAMANYDGTVVVRVQSGVVTLNANEGAVIKKGKDPVQVLRLLAAPKWEFSVTDTTMYTESIQLKWNDITGAAMYQVEIAPTKSFDINVRSYQGTVNSMRFNELALGLNYVRVRAYDSRGIRGNDSPVFTILRNPDLVPPPLLLDNDLSGAVYVQGDLFFCSGITETGSRVLINNQPVDVDARGRFGVMIQLDSRINKLDLIAVDAYGNRTAISRLIVRMQEEQLFKLDWTVPSREEGHIKKSDLIGVMGVAYAPLKVIVKTGRQQYETECKANGSWELYFNVPPDARSVEVRYVMKSTGKEVAKRTYLMY